MSLIVTPLADSNDATERGFYGTRIVANQAVATQSMAATSRDSVPVSAR